MLANNKSFDETASLFSEKQLDYALSTDGIVGWNKVVDAYRKLSTGASLSSVEGLLVERLGGVRDTWNTTNQAKIKNNEELEPYIVF